MNLFRYYRDEAYGIWQIGRAVLWSSMGRCPVHGRTLIGPQDVEYQLRWGMEPWTKPGLKVCPDCAEEVRKSRNLEMQ